MEWLSLAEYSMKHKVSISTLRRRIKAEDIQFKLEDGKYLVLDSQENLRKSQSAEDQFEVYQTSPSQANSSTAASITYNLETPDQFRVENIVRSGVEKKIKEASLPSLPKVPPPSLPTTEAGESVLTAANRLLTDLKKAYTQVLQEKEQTISDLREEVSDLKTLIKVLESENDRLREIRN